MTTDKHPDYSRNVFGAPGHDNTDSELNWVVAAGSTTAEEVARVEQANAEADAEWQRQRKEFMVLVVSALLAIFVVVFLAVISWQIQFIPSLFKDAVYLRP